MSGTPMESSLSQSDAVALLLNNQAPEEASEVIEEPTAEAPSAEASEAEEMEVEAVEEDQADAEVEEVEEDSDEVEEVDTYAVKIDGQDGEATIEELINSYQMVSTAQQRLQKVAEDKKAFEAEKAEFQQIKASTEQVRDQYEQGLAAYAKQLQDQHQPKDQSYWDDLYQNDQLEYAVQRQREQQVQQDIATVQAEQQRVNQIKLQDEQKKMLELIPEWKDPEVQTREKTAIVGWAKQQGFTDAQIATINDALPVKMLRMGWLYDEQQAQKPLAVKKVKKAPKMVKSGQPKAKSDSATERKRKAFAKLSKTNSKDAAVEYLLTR